MIAALLILTWNSRPKGNSINNKSQGYFNTLKPLQNEQKEISLSTCTYPSYVRARRRAGSVFYLSSAVFEGEGVDPTAKARVGPNPQSGKGANYTVIYNYASPVKAPGDFEEEEEEEGSDEPADDPTRLTLATHATPDQLYPDILTLLGHWPGPHPLSVAVYAPGEDFCQAAALISYLWTCHDQVRKQVKEKIEGWQTKFLA